MEHLWFFFVVGCMYGIIYLFISCIELVARYIIGRIRRGV